MAAATLVTGGCVVTMDLERRVLDDAAVLVVDGLIACVGSAAECADAAPSAAA